MTSAQARKENARKAFDRALAPTTSAAFMEDLRRTPRGPKVRKLPTVEVGVAVYSDGRVTPQESFGLINDLSFMGHPAPHAEASPVVRKEGAFGTRDYFVGFKLTLEA